VLFSIEIEQLAYEPLKLQLIDLDSLNLYREARTMRIAQVSPLIESTPPKGYGGTERAVSYLTEALVDAGHDVTLFASGDSQTDGRLVPLAAKSLRTAQLEAEHNAFLLAGLESIFRQSHKYDVIHLHTGYLSFPLIRRSKAVTVTTLHGRLDIPGLDLIADEYVDIPLVAISEAQKQPAPHLNWAATIFHGLPESLYSFNEHPEDYLCFVGRISKEKGIDEAIEIARLAGMKLKIAAKIDASDRDYYESVIKHKMESSPNIEFLSEIGEVEKNELMGNATGLLFPTMCNESFGLAMIEAMACGTPVIAFNNGAVPEVLDDGVTGFVCRSIQEAAYKVSFLNHLNRKVIRRIFEANFGIKKIAAEYVSLYENRIEQSTVLRHGRRFKMLASVS
jgi:glycosyltransferase involved in cell wall biosynthesis